MTWRDKLTKIADWLKEKRKGTTGFLLFGIIPTVYYALQGRLIFLILWVLTGLILTTLFIVYTVQRTQRRKLQQEWRLQSIRAMLMKEQKAWQKKPLKPLWED